MLLELIKEKIGYPADNYTIIYRDELLVNGELITLFIIEKNGEYFFILESADKEECYRLEEYVRKPKDISLL